MNLQSKERTSYNYFFKGICLIAGTCIGAGMIGLPIKTAGAGFYPTLGTFFFVWVIMTGSALLFLEVCLYFPGPVNFISMTKDLFGNRGKNIAWLVCLLFMYSVMAAYASGGAALIQKIFPVLRDYVAAIVFMLPFAIVTYFGSKWIGLLNRILTVGVMFSFVLLCGNLFLTATDQGDLAYSNLAAVNNFNVLLKALPVIVITMGYHEIIPSLKSYLKEKVPFLTMAVLVGSIISLIVYIIWLFLVLLLIPASNIYNLHELLVTNANSSSILIDYIAKAYSNHNIIKYFSWFSFFAFTCSLTGSSWALFDFFTDGLSSLKKKPSKLLINTITFIPPILYAVIFPNGFLKALNLAGVFSAIIMIIYPVVMAWSVRSRTTINFNEKKDDKNIEIFTTKYKYKAPINFFGMSIIFVFAVMVIIIELIC